MSDAADSIDVPACFYLGREVDPATKAEFAPPRNVMYEAKNLCTHGVIVGMTGSGKTGLSIALLEEAAIDGVPAIIIDPKGDLTNLLLQFPGCDPKDYEKWISPEDAKNKGMTPEAYAKDIAGKWRKGLADTGQEVDRAEEVTRHTDFRIYTPGSEAGLGLSILRTFAAPKAGMKLEDLTQKINATATALLGLSGISSDPVQSREHVLVTQLLNHAWSQGRDLDLTALIKEIQNPPIRTVGAYNLETFYPAKDRLKFASQLNNMLASPVFTIWTKGEPLDLQAMMFRNGRPQHNIFYLAHLDDSQRMFFTTLLLEEMLAWTRRQQGTTSLRAMLYFDEVFGYIPPHPGNPPSKQPLLTLLKQARAFGVGILLATQNPIDLDYKALSNAGTWFVGKLQTERDKARLLDGLETVAAEYGALTDRNSLESVIAGLGNRVFLLHNINQGKPKLFRTRFALSFLRGPMTRDEIGRLCEPVRARDALGAGVATKVCNHCGKVLPAGIGKICSACGKNPWDIIAGAAAPVAAVAVAGGTSTAAVAAAKAAPVSLSPPVLPPDVNQFYIPISGGPQPGRVLEYQPYILAVGEVAFQIDKRTGAEHRVTLRYVAKAPEPGHPVEWDKAIPIGVDPASRPEPNARWASVNESIDTGRKLKALEKTFADHVHGTQKLPLLENRELDLVSRPGEKIDAFRVRCRAASEAARDQAKEMERIKFTPKLDAANASTGKGREDRIARLNADYQSKLDELDETYRRIAEEIVEIQVKPRKTDVRVTHFGLAWAPFWKAV